MTTLPYDFMSFMDPTVQRYLADVVRCGNYGEMFRILRALLPDQALANYVYSYSDSLSGLPNYRAFLRCLQVYETRKTTRRCFWRCGRLKIR